jgi:hypothetical protein
MNNKEKGENFENIARKFLKTKGLNGETYELKKYTIQIGHKLKKKHTFDLGNEKILVPCKNYSVAKSGSNRSGEFATLNEEVLRLGAAPTKYKKVLLIAKSDVYRKKSNETIAQYYVNHYGYLIPDGIEIWELDDINMIAEKKFG